LEDEIAIYRDPMHGHGGEENNGVNDNKLNESFSNIDRNINNENKIDNDNNKIKDKDDDNAINTSNSGLIGLDNGHKINE